MQGEEVNPGRELIHKVPPSLEEVAASPAFLDSAMSSHYCCTLCRHSQYYVSVVSWGYEVCTTKLLNTQVMLGGNGFKEEVDESESLFCQNQRFKHSKTLR